MSRIIWQSGNKFLVRDNEGKIRKVKRDIAGIKKGWYLQPIGKEKDAFLKVYGYLPGEDEKEVKKYLKKRK